MLLIGMVSAYNSTNNPWKFRGVDNLSEFLGDIVTFIPVLVPLIVIITIIGVVYAFRNFLVSALKLK